jgi:hypothetical protein
MTVSLCSQHPNGSKDFERDFFGFMGISQIGLRGEICDGRWEIKEDVKEGNSFESFTFHVRIEVSFFQMSECDSSDFRFGTFAL